MRKLVYHVATSLDNFIARPDGSTPGFLAEGEAVTEYLETLQTYDTVVMGRATYEAGYAYGLQPGQPSPIYPGVHYIFSKTLQFETEPHERVKVIRTDPVPLIQELKAQPGSAIYLCGGGALAGYLFEHELIDELIVKLNPLLLGEGTRLFGTSRKATRLTLVESKTYPDGLLLLTYAVTPAA
jgi:dihydrofolate reductase